MEEKEIIIPIRFPVRVGTTRVRLGGGPRVSIYIKTKWPIVAAYFFLAWKIVILGMRKGLAI